MNSLTFQGSQHCGGAFLVFVVIIGFAIPTAAQGPNSTVGQEALSVHTIEQQIQNLYAKASKAVVRIEQGEHSRGIPPPRCDGQGLPRLSIRISHWESGPVIDASGQTVGIVIASRGRDHKLRGPTMVLPAGVVKAVADRVLGSQVSESSPPNDRSSDKRQ